MKFPESTAKAPGIIETRVGEDYLVTSSSSTRFWILCSNVIVDRDFQSVIAGELLACSFFGMLAARTGVEPVSPP
jgi:hypothetical protein